MNSLLQQSQSFGQRNRAPQENTLISIKAGKCILQTQADGKFQVVPDIRKGKIVLKTSPDGLLTFRWEARSIVNPSANNEVFEDERIIFPGEAKFKRINSGKPTDRVFLLSFNSGQKLLYWFQDKDESKDDELVIKINNYMNDPSAVTAAIASNAPPANAAPGQDELLRLLGLANPGNATQAPPQPAASTNQNFGGLDLSSILGALSNNAQNNNAGSANQAPPSSSTYGGVPSQPQQPIPLQEILTSDAIFNSGVLDDPQVRAQIIEQLPEGQRSEEFLEDNIRSPQFQQSLESLSSALQSDGGNAVMANIGVDPSPGTNDLLRGDAISAFLTSVQASADAESSPESNTSSDSTNNETGNNQDRMEE
eukprot:gene20221-26251_t